MAIIRTSSIVGAISGSIGGVTFSNAKTGLVLRQRPTRKTRASEIVFLQRARFATITRAWRELTDQQRSSWSSVAANTPITNRVGSTSNRTGFALFVRNNLYAAATDKDALTDPPLNITGYYELVWSISFNTLPSYGITIEVPNGIPGLVLQIFGARHFSKVAPKFPKNFRFLKNGLLTGPQSQGISLQPQWEDTFGLMEEGEAATVRLRFINSAYQIAQGVAVQQNTIVQP